MDRHHRRARIDFEKCLQAKEKGEVVACKLSDDLDSITISFMGPAGTPFETELYTIKWVHGGDYPFKRPNLFWVGQAPNHRFYRWDLDDAERVTRCTNIGNHGCGGINHQLHSPQLMIIDYIKLIQHSLTSDGEKEMIRFMDAH